MIKKIILPTVVIAISAATNQEIEQDARGMAKTVNASYQKSDLRGTFVIDIVK